MSRIDEVYQTLIKYIEQDNAYKLEFGDRLSSIEGTVKNIETQAKLTNGRVTKLENTERLEDISKAKLMGGLAVIVFMFSIGANILYNVIANWIANKLHI